MVESRLTKPDSDYCHDICGGVSRCARLKKNSKRCRGYYLYERLKLYENAWSLLSVGNEKEPPYSDIFPTDTHLQGGIVAPLDHMPMLLGKTVSTLPTEKQEQLKDAMRNYCEVCDYINNDLANQQGKDQ